ncbi:MAG: photosynthetic reaction center cytochrome c subunit family protein, partial [Pyrinomonadaceae bacterium]
HVNNGGDNWVWESDDKETKRVARQMMQMVVNLNKNNQADFRGSGITCYTCHRGQTAPQRIPTLPLTASEREADGAAREPKSKEPLPTVEQVLSRYVEAVGGAAAAKLKTLLMKGVREASEGRNWALEVSVKQPDKFLIAVTVPGQGIISQGFDGARGWLKNPREQRAMTADELAALRQTAELYEVIKIKGLPAEAKVTSIERIGGRESYMLEFTPAIGKVERWYFDVQTGLLLRKLTLTNTVLAPIPEQIDFEDYREVDGVKLPFVIRISDIDPYFNTTRRITEIRHSVPLDDARFNQPAGQK